MMVNQAGDKSQQVPDQLGRSSISFWSQFQAHRDVFKDTAMLLTEICAFENVLPKFQCNLPALGRS